MFKAQAYDSSDPEVVAMCLRAGGVIGFRAARSAQGGAVRGESMERSDGNFPERSMIIRAKFFSKSSLFLGWAQAVRGSTRAVRPALRELHCLHERLRS